MRNDRGARALRAVFGAARDAARFRPSLVKDTANTVVRQFNDTGFCSTDHVVIPISMPRIKALHGTWVAA